MLGDPNQKYLAKRCVLRGCASSGVHAAQHRLCELRAIDSWALRSTLDGTVSFPRESDTPHEHM